MQLFTLCSIIFANEAAKLVNRVTVKSILCLTDSHQHSLALISAFSFIKRAQASLQSN